MNKQKIFKSLKFKMTVWYSAILLFFSLIFVLVMNITLTVYMQKDKPFERSFGPQPPFMIQDITTEQADLIRQSRERDLNNIRALSFYSVIPLTILSFAGGYILVSRILRPLEDLDREMKNRNIENLSSPILFKDTGDEIASLIGHFNDMSKRVYASFKSQKEFVENASHELKTPLAIISANLENAIDEKNLSKKELNELLKESSKSVTFMNKLTEDLLLLSLLDTDIEREKINLKQLVEESVKSVSYLLKDSSFSVQINCPKGISIHGNRTLLIRAFQNIIENSIKYSEGTELMINVKKEERDLKLSFKDNGKGIKKESCQKIFQRFYRVDKSRSRKSGGSGLGLAITKEIVEKHDGNITCISDEKKGCEFVITLKEDL